MREVGTCSVFLVAVVAVWQREPEVSRWDRRPAPAAPEAALLWHLLTHGTQSSLQNHHSPTHAAGPAIEMSRWRHKCLIRSTSAVQITPPWATIASTNSQNIMHSKKHGFWINKDSEVLLHSLPWLCPRKERIWSLLTILPKVMRPTRAVGGSRLRESWRDSCAREKWAPDYSQPHSPSGSAVCVLHLYKYTQFIQVFKFIVNNS